MLEDIQELYENHEEEKSRRPQLKKQDCFTPPLGNYWDYNIFFYEKKILWIKDN